MSRNKLFSRSGEHQTSRKKLPTSKILMWFLFVNCTVVELFTMYVTVSSFKLAYATNITPDFTPLNTLVGTIVAEVIGFAVYCLKSTKENTRGGIIYDQAMAELQSCNEEGYTQEKGCG